MTLLNTRSPKRKFLPAVDAMENRALMSFGGGNINLMIPRLDLPRGNLNLTSNTWHDVNGRISDTAQHIVNNPNPTAVQNQINKLVSRLPNGTSQLTPILLADLQTFQTGTGSVTTQQADAIVENLFQTLLDRPVNSQSFTNSAVKGLQDGSLTVAALTTTIVTSPEYIGLNITDGASGVDNQTQLVSALYDEVLGHPADAFAINFWVNQFAIGKTPQEVASAIANSAEAATSSTSIIVENALPFTPPVYYFGAPAPNGQIYGNFGNSGNVSQVNQVRNLIQNDMLTYFANGIGVHFNILKSRLNFASDRLLTYNGRV
ncbi:DUF4214 domain-containing protein [Tundrisphaera lichenicola]|uniref:DUF4214 domain-containing protein n=1 Tax=Tundrisphaera lichenicola TaxID=2029860 RepID=UPI003EBD5713